MRLNEFGYRVHDKIDEFGFHVYNGVDEFGFRLLIIFLLPVSIASAEDFGTPTITSEATIAPTPIDSLEAFGSPLVAYLTKIKFVGRDDIALSGYEGSNFIWMTKFVAVATGDVIEIRFRTGIYAGNMYIGIYADSSGSPTDLLGQKAVAVSAGAERVITVTLDSAIPVVSGTTYWIASNSDALVTGIKTETAVVKYKSSAYAALPNPAGTGYADWTTTGHIAAGWGNVAVKTISPSGVPSMEAIGSLLLISPRYINLDATQESQLQSNSVDGFGTYAGGHTKAIVFRPTKNYTLKGVVLKMYRTGDAESNDVAVDLYSTQNSPYYGWPQTLLQSGSVISKATMTTDTNGAEYTSVFDYALTAGTLYTIVVNGNCNYNSGYMQVGILYQNTDVYPNGWFWWYFENYPQSWFTIGDAWFKILSDPLGIPSGQAFGTTVLTVGWVLQPSGIATAQAFGTASVIKLLQFLQPSGIASAQAFGTALVKKMLQILSLTAGISTAEAFGVPRTRLYLLPSGIISQEIFGSLKLNFKVYPSGIVTQVTFGNARFIMFVRPSGIATAQAFGSPNLLVRRFLYPLSILTGELFGILIIEVAIMLPPVRFGRPKRLLNAIRNLPSDREDGIRRMP